MSGEDVWRIEKEAQMIKFPSSSSAIINTWIAFCAENNIKQKKKRQNKTTTTTLMMAGNVDGSTSDNRQWHDAGVVAIVV